VVLTTPLIEVLKTNFPDCTIHFVCLPVCAELLKPDKRIEKIISFDKRGADSGWHGVYAFAKRLAAETYDGAIVPHRSARTAIIIKLSGVPKTITFDKSTLSLLYTNRVAYQPFIHEVERNLSLLQPLGISSHYVPPKLFASDAAVASVGKMLATVGKKPYAVIAPASTWATNMWTAEGFASLAQNLAAKNFAVILIGSKDDVALCNRIAGASSSVLNLAGKTTLSEAVEVLRGATFAVTNDSGPLHLAQAVDCRTIAIFGPTVPDFGFGPMGKNDRVVQVSGLACKPCGVHGPRVCPEGHHKCMKDISPEMVMAAIESITLLPNR
jgi:heptosyltransferase-2